MNRVDALWHYLKQVEIRNYCSRGLDWLVGRPTYALGRLRNRASVLFGFIHQVGYPFSYLCKVNSSALAMFLIERKAKWQQESDNSLSSFSADTRVYRGPRYDGLCLVQ